MIQYTLNNTQKDYIMEMTKEIMYDQFKKLKSNPEKDSKYLK